MPNPLALIIEDDVELCEILAEILQGEGIDTEVVHDGHNAYKIIHEKNPAVVVLDLHLPNVSGREILHQIRTTPTLRETKVVIVTADDNLANELEDQAELTLVKPVAYAQISGLVTLFVGK